MCPYCDSRWTAIRWENSWGDGNARCATCRREFNIVWNPDPAGPILIGRKIPEKGNADMSASKKQRITMGDREFEIWGTMLLAGGYQIRFTQISGPAMAPETWEKVRQSAVDILTRDGFAVKSSGVSPSVPESQR